MPPCLFADMVALNRGHALKCGAFVQGMFSAQMQMVYLINAMQASLIGLPIKNEQAARHQQH